MENEPFYPHSRVAIGGSIFGLVWGDAVRHGFSFLLIYFEAIILLFLLVSFLKVSGDLTANMAGRHIPSYKTWRLSRLSYWNLIGYCLIATLTTIGCGLFNWHYGTWADTLANCIRFIFVFFASVATGMLWIGCIEARRRIKREGFATEEKNHVA